MGSAVRVEHTSSDGIRPGGGRACAAANPLCSCHTRSRVHTVLLCRPIHGHADIGDASERAQQPVQQVVVGVAASGACAGPEFVIRVDGVICAHRVGFWHTRPRVSRDLALRALLGASSLDFTAPKPAALCCPGCTVHCAPRPAHTYALKRVVSRGGCDAAQRHFHQLVRFLFPVQSSAHVSQLQRLHSVSLLVTEFQEASLLHL
jgi:hypothetical protein